MTLKLSETLSRGALRVGKRWARGERWAVGRQEAVTISWPKESTICVLAIKTQQRDRAT